MRYITIRATKNEKDTEEKPKEIIKYPTKFILYSIKISNEKAISKILDTNNLRTPKSLNLLNTLKSLKALKIYFLKSDKSKVVALLATNKLKEIVYVLGIQNRPIKQRYLPYIQNFVARDKYVLRSHVTRDSFLRNGILNLDRKLVNIEEVKQGITIEKEVNLRDSCVTKLPDNLIIKGDLSLYNSKIKFLPNKLIVEKNLFISNTDIEELPQDLIVGDSLFARNAKFKILPKGVRISGEVIISGNTFESIQEGFTPESTIDLEGCTNLKSIPKEFKVRGDLILKNSSIKKLPKGLRVLGTLDISNTNITKIPEDLEVVKGELDVTNTKVKMIPSSCKIGGGVMNNGRREKMSKGKDLVIN